MADTEKKIPIGLQLFSVRGQCQQDLPAALKAVADIGYEGAEPWGYRGEELSWLGWSGPEIRKMFDDNGLVCCGMHLATEALIGDNLERTIELNQTLGNKFLIVAADKQRMNESVDTIMELADILNGVAERLKPLGMWTGYHAHPFDFVEFEGKAAWDILFSNTGDDVVMQLDNGNSFMGGGDPIALLKRYPGRARSLHIKDYGDSPDVVISEGDVDWDEFFHLAESLNDVAWYVVEEGGPDGMDFSIPRRSLEGLRRLGK